MESVPPGARGDGSSSDGFCPATVFIVDREPLYRWFVAESLDHDGVQVLPFEGVAEAASCPAVREPRTLLLIDGQTLRDEGPAPLAALRQRLPHLDYVVLEPAPPGPPRAIDGAARSAAKPVDCEAVRALVRAHAQYAR
jgi:DNA-binding NtrC family response regulator